MKGNLFQDWKLNIEFINMKNDFFRYQILNYSLKDFLKKIGEYFLLNSEGIVAIDSIGLG